MKFRKKPIIIDAIKWDGYSITYDKIIADFNAKDIIAPLTRDGKLYIKILEETQEANIGDWIVKNDKNEIYVSRKKFFEMTYEPINE